jgi:predicted RNA-binding protein with PIN domain
LAWAIGFATIDKDKLLNSFPGEVMPTLIDGYNLLFSMGRLSPRSSKHALEGARQWLLLTIRSGFGPGVEEVTVVFDAQHAPPGARSESVVSGIQVRFARGQTADDLIEEIIRVESNPKFLVVVSDDHRIQQAARRRGCTVQGCLDYYESLRAPPTPNQAAALDPPAKPDRSSPEEIQHWLDTFSDIDDSQMPDGF